MGKALGNRGQNMVQIVIVSMMVLVFTGLGVRLGYLQLTPHKEVTHSWKSELMARRGYVFDRNGKKNWLAASMAAWHVFADPGRVKAEHDPLQVAPIVAEALGMPVDQVALALCQTNTRYVALRNCLDLEVTNRLARSDISGIGWRQTTIRHYPQGPQMCYVLGFVDSDGVGRAGVELVYNDYLKGTSGVLESKADARRRELPWERSRHIPAVQGADVHLTLDQVVQHIAETELASTVEEFGAAGGCALVQRVATGEILAMASLPRFDPNYYEEDRQLWWQNRCVGYVYEPGSTMKAITISAVLNDGIVVPEDLVDCERGYWRYGGHTLHDHVKGLTSIIDVVRKSSNIGAAKMALRLGNSRFETYIRGFGLGGPLGIDLRGEEKGLLRASERWSKVKPTRIAIGQGVSVTPIQMLGVYCTIANRGRLMRPYVVSRVEGAGGNILYERVPEVIARPIRPETAATMCDLLRGVVEPGGTGTRAAVEGYSVAGKTGTAQIWDNQLKRYSNTEYVASFVGVLPAENPEIGIIVVIEKPRGKYYGGTVAGPAFSRIAGKTARYLKIAPPSAQRQGGGLLNGRAVAALVQGRERP